MRECSSGRLAKARQFANAFELVRAFAEDNEAIGDVCVTLAVHAGIAASDVICCARLGEHAIGESHVGAIELLRRLDPAQAKKLATLLRLKTMAGYHHESISTQELMQAQRAMTSLVAAAIDA